VIPILAQTIPGTEVVPLVLACSIFGYMAGVGALILSCTKASQRFVLAAVFLACGEVFFVAFLVLLGHDFSIGRSLGAIRRHWPMALLLALPLVFAAAAIAMIRYRAGVGRNGVRNL